MSKVCVLSQRVPFPPNKGEKLRTYHQIEFLKRWGYEVEVFSLIETAEDKKNADALAKHLGILVNSYQLDSKFTRYASAFLKGLPISVGAFYSKKLQYVIDEKLKKGSDALLLTASSLSYYIFNSPYHKSTHCRLFMDFMDVDSDKWAQYASSSSLLMRYVYKRESKGIKKLEAKTNQRFDECFLIAKEETQLFSTSVDSSKEITVLGNGLDFDAFYPAKVQPCAKKISAAPHFLFTGVMDYKPNVDAVLWFVEKCWPLIREKAANAKFTVGGMNPTEEIKALAGSEGIDVTGFVDDILPYFHKAHAFVAPFRLARGVQNKVLQAAACKLPIITTTMGAEGISFANADSMWIEDDVDSFVKACVQSIENFELSQRKALSSYQAIVSEYSWEQQLSPLKMAMARI
ncbi:TIGR03087 family PEP-CTERM/XrtA system glycosyltransferase [Alteromonas sp. ALT199]|uniref:TIGR03087 family PEP-CTERM/XrtA system glycosyltransferase n=1 Tax=unclassified Alteromonas TaxID=2614992 RepID=UPI001BE6E963|nr:TIGR03087 family PEP-CTERM/XrtA system glycosyltransferase [Alteromonas sp. ALT199]MBT3137292.1 TIGR03087 family PEP-CTERM/XrtA system glycosyltransferase [Alteromonas sp. ALT199]